MTERWVRDTDGVLRHADIMGDFGGMSPITIKGRPVTVAEQMQRKQEYLTAAAPIIRIMADASALGRSPRFALYEDGTTAMLEPVWSLEWEAIYDQAAECLEQVRSQYYPPAEPPIVTPPVRKPMSLMVCCSAECEKREMIGELGKSHDNKIRLSDRIVESPDRLFKFITLDNIDKVRGLELADWRTCGFADISDLKTVELLDSRVRRG